MRAVPTILAIILFSIPCYSQFTFSLDSVINQLSGNSIELTKSTSARLVISKGKSVLKELANFFADSTRTEVYSDCQGRLLTRGEIAMILADQIEMMPYALLTGIQNCTLQFCEANPNRIEYYFDAIEGMERAQFQSNYVTWLGSKTRKNSYGKIK